MMGLEDGQNKSSKTGRRRGGPTLHRGREARKCAAYPGSDKPSGLVGQSHGYPGQHWWEKEGKISPSQIPSGPDARVGIWASQDASP